MSANTTIDDTDSQAVYSTSPAWNTGVWGGQIPQPLMGTNHGTPNPGAVATFTFNGTAIYVYGYKASDHGYRDVSIDGANPVTCDGRTGSQGSRALVYWADGLSPGTHEITLKHTGTQGQYLNIDYFLVTSPPTYNNTQNNNSQSSSPTIGIIVGVVVTAAVASLLAAAWYLWHRRKTRLRSEKAGRTDLDGEGTKQMPVVAGAIVEPYVVEPFYAPIPNPGHGRPNVSPMFKPQHPLPHPESSSGYYSETTAPSTSSAPPSGYSPPPNRTQFAPLHLNAPSVTTGTAYTASTAPDSSATPWATSIWGETASQTNQRPAVDPSISKARYSGANTLGASSSTSRPLSPPIDDSVPPPQYEL